MFFNPTYLLFVSPALLLMMWAQFRIRSAYARGMEVPAGLSGAAAARHLLDDAGLFDVPASPPTKWGMPCNTPPATSP